MTPIKLGSYRSSVSGAFLYVRDRFPSLLYLLVMMLDRVIAVVSKTQTSKHQTSKTQTSKLQTPWKTIEIVNAVPHECIYFFTIIIIVTNPKCQITQQSRIDNCRQVKGFSYLYSKQKRERQEQWKNYFTFSRVISEKKKDLNSQDSATIDVVQIYRLLRSMRDRPQLLRGGRG